MNASMSSWVAPTGALGAGSPFPAEAALAGVDEAKAPLGGVDGAKASLIGTATLQQNINVVARMETGLMRLRVFGIAGGGSDPTCPTVAHSAPAHGSKTTVGASEFQDVSVFGAVSDGLRRPASRATVLYRSANTKPAARPSNRA
jgi:hypothetical protein